MLKIPGRSLLTAPVVAILAFLIPVRAKLFGVIILLRSRRGNRLVVSTLCDWHDKNNIDGERGVSENPPFCMKRTQLNTHMTMTIALR